MYSKSIASWPTRPTPPLRIVFPDHVVPPPCLLPLGSYPIDKTEYFPPLPYISPYATSSLPFCRYPARFTHVMRGRIQPCFPTSYRARRIRCTCVFSQPPLMQASRACDPTTCNAAVGTLINRESITTTFGLEQNRNMGSSWGPGRIKSSN